MILKSSTRMLYRADIKDSVMNVAIEQASFLFPEVWRSDDTHDYGSKMTFSRKQLERLMCGQVSALVRISTQQVKVRTLLFLRDGLIPLTKVRARTVSHGGFSGVSTWVMKSTRSAVSLPARSPVFAPEFAMAGSILRVPPPSSRLQSTARG